MKQLAIVVSFIIVGVWCKVASATVEVQGIGYSTDNVTWSYIMVELESTGYAVIQWNDDFSVVLGSEFSGPLPTAAAGKCHCSIGANHLCPCNKYCARLEEGDNWERGSCN